MDALFPFLHHQPTLPQLHMFHRRLRMLLTAHPAWTTVVQIRYPRHPVWTLCRPGHSRTVSAPLEGSKHSSFCAQPPGRRQPLWSLPAPRPVAATLTSAAPPARARRRSLVASDHHRHPPASGAGPPSRPTPLFRLRIGRSPSLPLNPLTPRILT